MEFEVRLHKGFYILTVILALIIFSLFFGTGLWILLYCLLILDYNFDNIID